MDPTFAIDDNGLDEAKIDGRWRSSMHACVCARALCVRFGGWSVINTELSCCRRGKWHDLVTMNASLNLIHTVTHPKTCSERGFISKTLKHTERAQ